ncbi:nif-specific transcriptional activator NifA [bacterium]|nr:MAG: nif-specific transcriptional activator NifA [bacterium]
MKSDLNAKKLRVLYGFSKLVGQALDLDRTLSDMLRVLSESLSMKRATITLRRKESNVLAIVASHGLTEKERQRGVYRINEGVTGHIFRTAQPYIIPDIRQEPLFLNRTGAREINRERISFLGVPILLGGVPIGVLNVDRLFGNEVSFEEDIEFLTVVSALIAQIVRLNREVEEREERLVIANKSLRAEISEKYHNFFLVGSSPSMQEVQSIIKKVAHSKASVLLLGESGTGKTLVARIIHEMSDRASYPFVKLNCAALPENLLESELFGYEKGAFTGADKTKPGRIEEACGGTLFLDEIGELPLVLQTKLLRFLQEREFERLGSNQTRKVDVRIITATNKNLVEAVKEGAFRGDLYYRLNVIPLHIPALRERRGDIPSLIDLFLKKFATEYNKPLQLTPEAREALISYKWPGNVRELENLVERIAILAEGEVIGLEDLPLPASAVAVEAPAPPKPAEEEAPRSPAQKSLKELERDEMLRALERNDWIQARAAKELGLSERQFSYRVKKLGLKLQIFIGK